MTRGEIIKLAKDLVAVPPVELRRLEAEGVQAGILCTPPPFRYGGYAGTVAE